MWSTVLVMAAAAGADPVRIGLVAAMLSRRNPAALLLAYFCAGFAVNMVVGGAILFLSRHAVAGASIPATAELAIGVVVLLLGAVAVIGLPGLRRRDPDRPAGLDALPGFARLPQRVQTALRGESVVVAALIGLCMGFPTPYYLAALAAVLTAGSAPAEQVAALLVFNVIGFAAALLPLIGFRVAPTATRRRVDQVHAWVKANHRLLTGAVAGLVGGFFVVTGLAHL